MLSFHSLGVTNTYSYWFGVVDLQRDSFKIPSENKNKGKLEWLCMTVGVLTFTI